MVIKLICRLWGHKKLIIFRGEDQTDPHHQKRTVQEASVCLKLASNSIGLWNPLAECSLTGL
jgi:hypothetical protein